MVMTGYGGKCIGLLFDAPCKIRQEENDRAHSGHHYIILRMSIVFV